MGVYICKDKKMVAPQLLNILLHISIRMRDLVVSVVFPAHKIHGITGVADELELVIDYLYGVCLLLKLITSSVAFVTIAADAM